VSVLVSWGVVEDISFIIYYQGFRIHWESLFYSPREKWQRILFIIKASEVPILFTLGVVADNNFIFYYQGFKTIAIVCSTVFPCGVVAENNLNFYFLGFWECLLFSPFSIRLGSAHWKRITLVLVL
jgi:hypothetical protein